MTVAWDRPAHRRRPPADTERIDAMADLAAAHNRVSGMLAATRLDEVYVRQALGERLKVIERRLRRLRVEL